MIVCAPFATREKWNTHRDAKLYAFNTPMLLLLAGHVNPRPLFHSEYHFFFIKTIKKKKHVRFGVFISSKTECSFEWIKFLSLVIYVWLITCAWWWLGPFTFRHSSVIPIDASIYNNNHIEWCVVHSIYLQKKQNREKIEELVINFSHVIFR